MQSGFPVEQNCGSGAGFGNRNMNEVNTIPVFFRDAFPNVVFAVYGYIPALAD